MSEAYPSAAVWMLFGSTLALYGSSVGGAEMAIVNVPLGPGLSPAAAPWEHPAPANATSRPIPTRCESCFTTIPFTRVARGAGTPRGNHYWTAPAGAGAVGRRESRAHTARRRDSRLRLPGAK